MRLFRNSSSRSARRAAAAGGGPARTLLLALWLGALCAPAALAGGFLSNSEPKEPVKHEFAVPAARKPVEGEGLEALQTELHNSELRVQESQQNAETARWALTRARTRRYPRGEALQQMKDRLAEMEKERDEAEAEFTALVEKARREGMPAGTLMPYMDLGDEIQRQRAERAAASPDAEE